MQKKGSKEEHVRNVTKTGSEKKNPVIEHQVCGVAHCIFIKHRIFSGWNLY